MVELRLTGVTTIPQLAEIKIREPFEGIKRLVAITVVVAFVATQIVAAIALWRLMSLDQAVVDRLIQLSPSEISSADWLTSFRMSSQPAVIAVIAGSVVQGGAAIVVLSQGVFRGQRYNPDQ